MQRTLWLTLLLLAAGLTGCIGQGPATDPAASATEPDWPACQHPWPCADGTEWPTDLEGPFELERIEEVTIQSHDGTPLHGYVLFPDVAGDPGLPVVLWSTLYFGQLMTTPGSPTWDVARVGGDIPVDRLVEEGYVVAMFNVRGSGGSGGCFGMFGADEQQDNVAMVEWLASQPWSNGRVGMSGISYGGTTPWEAAIHAPEGLKTIVPGGIVSDLYTFYHSIQGAPFTPDGAAHMNAWAGAFSLAPPTTGSPEVTATSPTRAPERACPETAALMAEAWKGTVGDDRDATIWGERRLIDRFPNVTASVLLYHGLLDLSGHQTQERDVWHTLDAPKRALFGQWGHTQPSNADSLPAGYGSWDGALVAWFDFWLKGVGEPDWLGVVDYQDDQGDWHRSSAWPPAEARPEVLYPTGGGLAAQPGGDRVTFRSAPHPDGAYGVLCDHLGSESLPALVDGEHPLGVVQLTEPVQETTLIAGNPVALLQLESNLPTGLVDVHLFRVQEGGTCADEKDGFVRTADRLAWGTADLRFHTGTFQGTDFPTGQATPVRIDVTNLAEVLEPGQRLAVVFSYGQSDQRMPSTPAPPTLTLHLGDSSATQVLVPVVEGGFGADGPVVDYPPRPFLPGSAGG